MFVEYYHRFRQKDKVLVGVPDDLLESKYAGDPANVEGEYLGRVSEHEIIGRAGSSMAGTALVYIDRDLYKMESIEKLSLAPIPRYDKIRTMGGWHGPDVNTNLVVGFNKKQLIEILNSMQASDTFNIAHLPSGYKGK